MSDLILSAQLPLLDRLKGGYKLVEEHRDHHEIELLVLWNDAVPGEFDEASGVELLHVLEVDLREGVLLLFISHVLLQEGPREEGELPGQ